MFMNPFEVREVLQETHVRWQRRRCSQSLWSQGSAASLTTQSASSSNPLNPFEVREVLQGAVSKRWSRNLLSIPLKSGKCCKVMWYSFKPEKDSQSLWSQGSAASCTSKKHRSRETLNPFEVREVLQGITTKNTRQKSFSQSLWSQGSAAS